MIVGTLACQVWLSPSVPEHLGASLQQVLGGGTLVRPLGPSLKGPAILIAHINDLRRDRPTLRALADSAPGRPLVIGGNHNRDILLECLNRWQALRVLEPDVSADRLATDVRFAHERLELDAMISLRCAELRRETARLEVAAYQLKKTESLLVHREQLTTIARMLNGVAEAAQIHVDLTDNLSRHATDQRLTPTMQELVGHLGEGMRAVNRMLSDLRAFASPAPNADPRAMEDFDDIVSQAVSFARFDRDCANRHIVTHLRSDASLFVDRLALYQVFLNLLRNAVEATRPGGRVEVRTFTEGDFVCAEFTDNGAGVPVELRGRLFDAFATGRHQQGIGLGLQSSKRIVERHGGTIAYCPAAGGGSQFVVRMPIHASPQRKE